MTTDVRVGIVSWNTAELLDRALGSLLDALGKLSAEVIVVDNASSDASVEVARSYPWLDVVENRSNLGYAKAMNIALAGTAAKTLIALNPDTYAPPDSLEKLVATLGEDSRIGLVVPRLVDADGLPQRSAYPYPGLVQALETGFVPRRWRRGEPGRDGASMRELSGRWAVGAVHCIRRAALGEDPPYSTRWFMYVEDIELCWRLEKAGWRVVMRDDVDIVHHGNASGVQRWGDGAALELRSLPNIYEWLWSERSPIQGRATALANMLGTEMKRAALGTMALTAKGPRAHSRKRRADELARLVAFHARVLRDGPSRTGRTW